MKYLKLFVSLLPLLFSVFVPMIIYLWWPNSIDPAWVFWPASALFGTAAAYMFVSLKRGQKVI